MSQTRPTYGHMTSSVNRLITEPLIKKYGHLNVVNPIVVVKEGAVAFYLYEVTLTSSVNKPNSNKPESLDGIQHYFIDYESSPRRVSPPSKLLDEFMQPKFACCYDFILQQEIYNSVDIDYVWFSGEKWKAMELTTVYTPLTNQAEAERLVKMFYRRPSWTGISGPRAIYTLIEAAADLSLEYYFVIVNSARGVSNELVVDGNAYWFPLTKENVERIVGKSVPLNGRFGPFSEMLSFL